MYIFIWRMKNGGWKMMFQIYSVIDTFFSLYLTPIDGNKINMRRNSNLKFINSRKRAIKQDYAFWTHIKCPWVSMNYFSKHWYIRIYKNGEGGEGKIRRQRSVPFEDLEKFQFFAVSVSFSRRCFNYLQFTPNFLSPMFLREGA